MVFGLQSYLQGKDRAAKVLIRMKLLWISDHTYGQYKLIRLHLVDARAPESLKDMLRVRCQHQAFNSERIHLIFQCRYRYFKPHTRPIGRTSLTAAHRNTMESGERFRVPASVWDSR
jgi:hypothetical protein